MNKLLLFIAKCLFYSVLWLFYGIASVAALFSKEKSLEDVFEDDCNNKSKQ